MEKLKENILTIIVSVVLTGIVFLGGIYGFLNKQSGNQLSGMNFLETTRSAAATTTTAYLNSNAALSASTTAIFKIDKAVDLDLNIIAVASSTNTRLSWAVAFSNNYSGTCSTANAVCSTTDNGDWFFADGESVDTTTLVTHGAGRVENFWALNSSTTESCGTMCFTKNFDIANVKATYMKLFIGSRVTDASVWYELMRQVPYSGR